MLVLDRYLGRAICIGKNIKIKVLRTGARRVQLGVEAPRHIPVWREELGPPADRLAAERRPASDFRVLLVEDDPNHAEIVRQMLTECNTTLVQHVATGEDALELLTKAAAGNSPKPNLVLLDLHLPGISGLEVIESLKACDPLAGLPVVVLSCSERDADVARCISAGANAFVCKAADYDNFRDSIYRIADFWRHARQVA
jgi:carbon storage regulator CsrA